MTGYSCLNGEILSHTSVYTLLYTVNLSLSTFLSLCNLRLLQLRFDYSNLSKLVCLFDEQQVSKRALCFMLKPQLKHTAFM